FTVPGPSQPHIIGSTHDDTLNGDSSANVLYGNAGNDTLNGGDGADTLIGGAGDDTLNGGNQNDLFVLQPTGGGHDTISTLTSGADGIFVDTAANLTITTSTTLAAADFHTGDETLAATWNGGSGSNEFVWNAGTQELWFSANGTGSD